MASLDVLDNLLVFRSRLLSSFSWELFRISSCVAERRSTVEIDSSDNDEGDENRYEL